ncbi:S26 family signal peptidase [Streptomyces echinatus]|uniref:S26 family signal peptidase n=1 Tax=Streptomyces echinatus TaxID=67293 RepID=UPI00378E6C86
MVLALVCGCLAGLACAFRRLRTNFRVVRLNGSSMEPAYRDGDRLLVRLGARPKAGQVVMAMSPTAWHPHYADRREVPGGTEGFVVKRVLAVTGDPAPRGIRLNPHDVLDGRIASDRLVLVGDNSRVSFDSRKVGCYPADQILGVVLRALS